MTLTISAWETRHLPLGISNRLYLIERGIKRSSLSVSVGVGKSKRRQAEYIMSSWQPGSQTLTGKCPGPENLGEAGPMKWALHSPKCQRKESRHLALLTVLKLYKRRPWFLGTTQRLI